MDYSKIGSFIMNERKEKKLTQAKLAEKIFVSEKTISKWENGNGVPDVASLKKLSEIFEVSINELLNGERVLNDEYVAKAEQTILKLQNSKEKSDKNLLMLEFVLGGISALFLICGLIISMFLVEKFNLTTFPILVIVVSSVVFIVGMLFCLFIEQKAGYYVCGKCKHKYVPNYKQVCLSMHLNRTRFMKCPNCNKRSWHKKIIK